MGIFGDLRESLKGTDAVSELELLGYPPMEQNSIAHNISYEPVFKTDLIKTDKPKDIDYEQRKSSYFVDAYIKSSYYFNHCSIFATVVLRIVQETLRNGIEWQPKFQCKCPNCGTEFPRSTKICTQCGFRGEMLKPDESQKKLLVNWEGKSLIDRANKAGWDLLELCRSFLILSLVYNQPVILCQSIYAVDEHGSAIEEFPQQFTPLDPAKSRMIYDESGEPGDGTGFTLLDRKQTTMLDDKYWHEVLTNGYGKDGLRYYPARWSITTTVGGTEAGGDFYAEEEIYRDTYMLPSVNYGQPLCMLVEVDIRAWMALELRVCKYFSTGHPQGIFVINNISADATAKMQQAIRLQMREDPYTIPVIGIPPASDRVTSTKWHPFAIDPAESMIAVKQELLQRICAVYGMAGLFLGDTESMKGTGNESHQVAMLDRNLVTIRRFLNRFLAWIVGKYKGINDFKLVVREPPDNQSIDEGKKFEQNLRNAKMAQEIGFEVISQADGEIQISATPRKYDPISSMFGEEKPKKESFNVFKDSMSKDLAGESGDLLKDSTTRKGVTREDLARMIGEFVLQERGL